MQFCATTLLKSLSLALFLMLLAACQPGKYDRSFKAESKDTTRISSVIIHYTQEEDERSIELLTKAEYPVSSHYLLASKAGPKGIRVYELVPEVERAWHAGRSGWKNWVNLNDTSIGIEIVYTITCENGMKSSYETCVFPEFDTDQIDELIRLLKDIQTRYPNIGPLQFIGHSDIAPTRKIDPGPRFPWRRLYDNGIGAWYDDDVLKRYLTHFQASMPETDEIEAALKDIGYVYLNPEDLDFVVKAFQAHFLPHKITGIFDPLTAAALFALREKYASQSSAFAQYCALSSLCSQ